MLLNGEARKTRNIYKVRCAEMVGGKEALKSTFISRQTVNMRWKCHSALKDPNVLSGSWSASSLCCHDSINNCSLFSVTSRAFKADRY